MISSCPDFLVSIHCMTYNHASYIEDAMDGFSMQQTNFPFVAIIVDDASTDGEQEVILRYLDSNFDMEKSEKWETNDAHFIYAHHQSNYNCYFLVILLKYNFWQAKKDKAPLYKEFEEKTKFIALCEGDDYWRLPQKLQSQYNYLSTHNECGMVFNKSLVFNLEKNKFIGKCGKDTDFEKTLFLNSITTCSVCYRKSIYESYTHDVTPQKTWLMGDYPLWLYIIYHTKVKCIEENDSASVYRELPNSASHFKDLDSAIKFQLSAFDVRMYFTKKYHVEHLNNKLATCALEVCINQSLLFNQSPSLSIKIIKLILRYKIRSCKTLIKFFMCMSSFGRSLLLRRIALIDQRAKNHSNF